MALSWFVPEATLEEHFDQFFRVRAKVVELPVEVLKSASRRNMLPVPVTEKNLKAVCWVVLAGTPRRAEFACQDLCQLRYGSCDQERLAYCNIKQLPKPGVTDFDKVWQKMMPTIMGCELSLELLLGPKRLGYFKHWLGSQVEDQNLKKPKKERAEGSFEVPELLTITIADFESDPWFQFMKVKEKTCSPSLASQLSL